MTTHPSSSSDRARRWLLGASAAIVAIAVALVVHWGTRWTLPGAADTTAPYTLLATWDGSSWPSGGFDRPIGIAVAPGGDVYVIDARDRVVHLGSTGDWRGQWGTRGDGPGQFENPVGVAVGPDGDVFVSDYFQDRIQQFDADGTFVRAFGRSGSGRGEFRAPAGLAVDSAGAVYVADFYNDRVQKFGSGGSFEAVIGHAGRVGPGALHYPTGVALTPAGDLLAADAYNYQLQWFDRRGRPRRRRGDHLVWLWPRPADSTNGFNAPTGVAVSRAGIIHVADSGNHRVVMLSATGAFMGAWSIPHPIPGVYSPEQVAVSPDGLTLYTTDLAANRVLVLRVERAP